MFYFVGQLKNTLCILVCTITYNLFLNICYWYTRQIRLFHVAKVLQGRYVQQIYSLPGSYSCTQYCSRYRNLLHCQKIFYWHLMIRFFLKIISILICLKIVSVGNVWKIKNYFFVPFSRGNQTYFINPTMAITTLFSSILYLLSPWSPSGWGVVDILSWPVHLLNCNGSLPVRGLLAEWRHRLLELI